MQNANRENGNRGKILILLLLLITVIAVGVTIWALFFRDTAPALTPDYAPQQEETNAEPIGDEDDEKLEAEEGGGAVSISYSNEAEISLSAGGYEGKFAVLYYDPDTGEKAVVNTEIPVTITVSE